MLKQLSAGLFVSILCQAALAADANPCTGFKWDVSHELAVMKQTAEPVAAAAQPASNVPELKLDKPYELKLADQGTVKFAAAPGKPTLPDGTHGGLVRFSTPKAGRYRVSMTSGHWIDVVDGQALIKSRDFNGARGCERPRKIVEFDLPAREGLTLQLSGAADTPVVVSITAVAQP